MGLFSSKKKTSVSSVVYNLAGDEKDRPQYLQGLITKNILSGTKSTIAESLNSGYLKGPGIKFRSFHNWATKDDKYSAIGIPDGKLTNRHVIPNELLLNVIPQEENKNIWVQYGYTSLADYSVWAEQYIMQHTPELLTTDWKAVLNEETLEVSILHETPPNVSFTMEGFRKDSNYIYCYYTFIKDSYINNESSITNTDISFFSDISNAILLSSTTNLVKDIKLTTTIENIVDDIVVSSSNSEREEDYLTNTNIYEESIFKGTSLDKDSINKDVLEITQLSDYKIITTVSSYSFVNSDGKEEIVKTTTESLVEKKNETIKTTEIVIKEWEDIKLFIYEIGSGNTELDSLYSEVTAFNDFFPIIPIRLENEFVSPDYKPEVYALSKKAYKRATSNSFDKLVEKIGENESLGDIDFAYAVFGVSLNVKENACKKYIYNFFKQLVDTQLINKNIFTTWEDKEKDVAEQLINWNTWKAGQSSSNNPLFGAEEPDMFPRETSGLNEIRVSSNSVDKDIQYDIRISWEYMLKGEGEGLCNPTAKPDTYFIEVVKDNFLPTMVYTANYSTTSWNKPTIRIYKQVTKENYVYIDVIGLEHRNYVYNGHYVSISAVDALEDAEESGFIIPLHGQTYRDLPLVDSTQMATACLFIVFNCYTITKQKWYQRGIFKIFLIVAMIVISVAFPGLGIGTVGVLGTNAAVGASLGFSGVTAAIVGAIANAAAALIISTLIEKTVVGIFGEKIGGFLSQIITFFVMMGASSFAQNGSFAINFGELTKIDNILKLTNALADGYVNYVQANITEMANDHEAYMENYNSQLREVQLMYSQEFGNTGSINPMWFTNSNNIRIESGDTFLTRTLMVGSDLAEMSNELINNFADLSLKLPTPYS